MYNYTKGSRMEGTSMEKNPYQIIRTNYPSYSKVFRVIADYILNNPEEVLQSNIHQLARDLDIAESSIVRFCKTIGYSGFSELKIMLAKYGRQSSKIIFENLKDGSPEATSRDIFSLSIETLQIAAEQLDFGAVKQAADLLSKAERVVICGVGASASVAESFAAHLLRIGITAEASTDSELMQLIARAANDRTLFIAITKSGRNLPLVHAFELAKSRGAMTVCMTGFEHTPIEKFCDVQIVHYCPTTILMSSRIVQNTIIDCLCINATIQRQDEIEKIWAENRKVIECLRI